MTLTTQDVRALRNADRICFDHRGDTGAIRAILDGEHSSTGFEQTHTITVTSSVRTFDGPTEQVFTGFSMWHSPKFSDVAQTILRHLRADSSVHLEWWRGNSSPLLNDAGMVCDELRIRVQRGKVCDVFIVEKSVGRDNSARMVKVA